MLPLTNALRIKLSGERSATSFTMEALSQGCSEAHLVSARGGPVPYLRTPYLTSVKDLVWLHLPNVFGFKCDDGHRFSSSLDKLNLDGNAILVTVNDSPDISTVQSIFRQVSI
jgi:hypothetical protein